MKTCYRCPKQANSTSQASYCKDCSTLMRRRREANSKYAITVAVTQARQNLARAATTDKLHIRVNALIYGEHYIARLRAMTFLWEFSYNQRKSLRLLENRCRRLKERPSVREALCL